MHAAVKSAMAGIICTVVFQSGVGLRAQDAADIRSSAGREDAANRNSAPKKTLSKRDRSSVITVALRTKKVRHPGADCSHLVHAIYERAGFPYTYADSEDLYAGAHGFRRVEHPEPADLVVWHGHVGIVIRPAGHQFFSMLSTGPGVDDYRSRYWKSRGQPRFYRYVRSDS